MKAQTLLLSFIFLQSYSFAETSGVDLYLKKIKPLFKERCFACHGALKQKGKLRVDTVANMHKKDIIKEGELLERLITDDEDDKMPPEGEPLSKDEIAIIKKWLAAGAPAPKGEKAEEDPKNHWSFQKIKRPKLPESSAKNPVDAFLQAKLKSENLKAQGMASRTLLLRRLYLDLIGLPPKPEQLTDKRPIEEIVDSLLASKHYGERWGRHWMDVWRYSDWYGLGAEVRGSQKHLYHWRDWIVNSLNEDKGYDKMVREMLAGDEIAPTDPKVLAATGYLTRSFFKFNRTTWLDSVVEHTGKAFLGMTFNCAKCHDHKYDPLDHNEYYKFRAIFEPYHVRTDAIPGETDLNINGLSRAYDGNLESPTYLHKRGEESKAVKSKNIPPGPPAIIANGWSEPQSIKLPVEAWAPGIRKAIQENQLEMARKHLVAAQKNLQERLAKGEPEKAVKKRPKKEVKSDAPAKLILTDNFQRSRPDFWTMIGEGWRYQGGLLSLTEASLGESYLRSKAAHPEDFDLTIKFQTTGGERWKSTGIRFDVDDSGDNSHIVYASAFAGGSKVQLAHRVDGMNLYPGDAKKNIPVKLNQEYTLNIKVKGNLINVSFDGQFLFSYKLPRRTKGSIELFAYDSTADFYSVELKKLASNSQLKNTKKKAIAINSINLLALAKAKVTFAEKKLEFTKARIAADKAILKGVGNGSKEAASRLQMEVQLAKAEVQLISADQSKKAQAIKNKDKAKAALKSGKFPTYKRLQGSVKSLPRLNEKESLPSPDFPKTSTGRRTALVKWMTNRDNPLTARVAINHIWMRHFGTPLVETVFDFGRQAPKPLHQDILDYLAVELIESNWSMKHIHRLILNSQAWQRTSSNLNANEENLAIDPENKYYWRMNNRRMESQVVRDSLLSLAGSLDLKMGGPSLTPSAKVKRRSIYLFHSRDGRDKLLSTFDDADVLACYQRSESIVPQQALALMNSQTATEAAKQISAQFNSVKSSENFISAAFLKILGRKPGDEEIKESLAFLKLQPKRENFIHALLNLNDFQVIR